MQKDLILGGGGWLFLIRNLMICVFICCIKLNYTCSYQSSIHKPLYPIEQKRDWSINEPQTIF